MRIRVRSCLDWCSIQREGERDELSLLHCVSPGSILHGLEVATRRALRLRNFAKGKRLLCLTRKEPFSGRSAMSRRDDIPRSCHYQRYRPQQDCCENITSSSPCGNSDHERPGKVLGSYPAPLSPKHLMRRLPTQSE